MDVFLELYKSLFPYLLFIPLGYWVNKKGWISKSWITKPLIYGLMPVLVVNHVLEADAVKLAILPVLSFLLAGAMIFPARLAYKKIPKADEPFLLESSFSFFNVAFFGIPIVTALFGEDGVTTLICIYVGTALYGNTIGYFQVAKSKYSSKEAFSKIFRIPFLYVFILALGLKLFQIETPDMLSPVIDVFSVVVSAGGMMMVGMNVLKVDFKSLDKNYFMKILSLRMVSAAMIMALLLLLEYWLIDKLEEEDRQMLALIPFFPVAANVTVYASFLESKEEQSGVLVLLTVAMSLIFVPLVAMWF
jgi:predicted permease